MKKFILVVIVALLLLGTTSYAQVTTPNNLSLTGTQFVGFSGVGPGPANTKN
jgi:hypothetical protein